MRVPVGAVRDIGGDEGGNGVQTGWRVEGAEITQWAVRAREGWADAV
jgi:hypothetical protein